MTRKIDLIMNEINKKYKAELIHQGTDIIEIDKIPFSSPTANYMTYGGIPVGKFTEFYGGEGGGKTTSALDIVKNAQIKFKQVWEKKILELDEQIEALANRENKQDKAKRTKLEGEKSNLLEEGPKLVVYVDAEQTLDTQWAQLLGVNTEELILVRPQAETAEQVLQIIIDLVATGNVGLVVLDSIPMLVSQNIFDESMEKKSYGGISQALTTFCQKITPHLNTTQCAFIGINQVREDLSSMYNTESTPGGKAWKHACSLRIKVRKGSFLDENRGELTSRAENPAGNKVELTITKSKSCKSDRRLGYYTLSYTDGIDIVYDTVTVALQYGLVRKSGAWYYIQKGEEEQGFQGLAKILNYLRENDEELSILINTLEAKMNERS